MSSHPSKVQPKSVLKTFDSIHNNVDTETVKPLQNIPPKPPRSAFMCYTDATKEESTVSGGNTDVTEEKILNSVAAKWKSLTDRQRAEWEEVSRQDKVRFAREKAEYKGPWEVPKRRARKHPLAPKRPMSAFLKFSQKRRHEVKDANPEMNNTDISRLLGELWRAADAQEKEPYVESEKVERAEYNEAIAIWREEQAHLDAASRKSHHSIQQLSVDKCKVDAPPIKKKRRETIPHPTSDPSRASAPAYASSDGRVVDRRIFRSYSGSSHPHENKPYTNDPRHYHSTYYPSDTTRSHNEKGEQNAYYHYKPADAYSYKPETINTSASSGMNSIQPVEYPSRYHQYRPQQYPTPHGENRHTLPNTGSDLFDNGFHDPEPAFNPRQTRPSSHYNGYFFP